VQEEIAYSVKVAPATGAAPVEYQSKLKQVVRSLKVDQPIPATVFAFIPPADAKEQPAQTARPHRFNGHGRADFQRRQPGRQGIQSRVAKGRPCLLDFWETRCGPCIKSMPTTEKLYADYKAQGLVVLAVDVDETRDTVDKFLKTNPVAYPVVMGTESGIPPAYGVSAFPTFVLIGPDGKVAAHQIGFSEAALSGIVSKAGLTAAAPPAK
jgi:thiol-disulfide isomerase/thioredoxin